jgi:hypothetical protein
MSFVTLLTISKVVDDNYANYRFCEASFNFFVESIIVFQKMVKKTS